MSKKIAAGADGIVLDVKCGLGAFMQTREDAEELARLMVAIGEHAGKKTKAFVTSMDEPLGNAVGNALEIEEAIAVLSGTADQGELREVCLQLGGAILQMAGVVNSIDAGERILAGRIADGSALRKLRAMVAAQGGDPAVVDDPGRLPRAGDIVTVPSPADGFVQAIDARRIGLVAMDLGAGRKLKGEAVDHAVGVVLVAHVGDCVRVGQPLAYVHTNHRIANGEAIQGVLAAFRVGEEEPPRRPHVLQIVG
jgi:thymidine phosphorylase